MGKTSSARKTAYKYARSREDVAQNKLIKELERDVANMKQTVERKYSYIAAFNTPITGFNNATAATRTVGFQQIRIGTVQGTTDNNNRIGDTVSVKSLSLKYNLKLTAGAGMSRVRVLLLWDKEPVYPNPAGVYQVNSPQWQQLLQALTATSPANALPILSPKDHDTGNRFGVLYDEVHTLLGDPTSFVGPRQATNTHSFSKAYKIGKKLRYTDGGTQPNNHSLYLCYIQDSVSTAPQMDYSLKCIYEDA